MKIRNFAFIALLAAHVEPFVICYDEKSKKVRTDEIEAPFVVRWEDGTKSNGSISVSLSDLRGNEGLLRSIDNQKVAEWVKLKMEKTSNLEGVIITKWRASVQDIVSWRKEK